MVSHAVSAAHTVGLAAVTAAVESTRRCGTDHVPRSVALRRPSLLP
jgi:hypothetical protein